MSKYQSSNLSPQKATQIRSQLLFLLENQKIYQNPNLTLPYLAKRIQTNTKYLSQVINQQFNYNFTTLINHYRIKEFKQRLLSKETLQFTYFGLAQEYGFHNRSTFYRAFKSNLKLSPKQFIQYHEQMSLS